MLYTLSVSTKAHLQNSVNACKTFSPAHFSGQACAAQDFQGLLWALLRDYDTVSGSLWHRLRAKQGGHMLTSAVHVIV